MSDIQREIVQRLFESKGLNEASFDAGGKHYSSAFGHYSCDGESISREEYFDAKDLADTSNYGQSDAPWAAEYREDQKEKRAEKQKERKIAIEKASINPEFSDNKSIKLMSKNITDSLKGTSGDIELNDPNIPDNKLPKRFISNAMNKFNKYLGNAKLADKDIKSIINSNKELDAAIEEGAADYEKDRIENDRLRKEYAWGRLDYDAKHAYFDLSAKVSDYERAISQRKINDLNIKQISFMRDLPSNKDYQEVVKSMIKPSKDSKK